MTTRFRFALLFIGAVSCPLVTLFDCDRVAAETGQQALRRAAGSTPFVRVLGTAQDGGLPHTACSCPRCELARRDPAARRLVAAIALVLPQTGSIYLVDATPDLGEQLYRLRDVRDAAAGRVDRAPVDAIFLTHAHMGHYLGLAHLGFEAVSTSSLPVHGTPRMIDFLRNNGPWSQLVDLGNIAPVALPSEASVKLGRNVFVRPFTVPHRDEYADTVGYILKGPTRTLVYLPDIDSWRAWQRSAVAFLQEFDLVLVDGTFFSPAELPGRSIESIGHPLITDTMDLLQPAVEAGRLEVFFTHFNHSNPAIVPNSKERLEIERRGFHVLNDGDQFDL